MKMLRFRINKNLVSFQRNCRRVNFSSFSRKSRLGPATQSQIILSQEDLTKINGFLQTSDRNKITESLQSYWKNRRFPSSNVPPPVPLTTRKAPGLPKIVIDLFESNYNQDHLQFLPSLITSLNFINPNYDYQCYTGLMEKYLQRGSLSSAAWCFEELKKINKLHLDTHLSEMLVQKCAHSLNISLLQHILQDIPLTKIMLKRMANPLIYGGYAKLFAQYLDRYLAPKSKSSVNNVHLKNPKEMEQAMKDLYSLRPPVKDVQEICLPILAGRFKRAFTGIYYSSDEIEGIRWIMNSLTEYLQTIPENDRMNQLHQEICHRELDVGSKYENFNGAASYELGVPNMLEEYKSFLRVYASGYLQNTENLNYMSKQYFPYLSDDCARNQYMFEESFKVNDLSAQFIDPAIKNLPLETSTKTFKRLDTPVIPLYDAAIFPALGVLEESFLESLAITELQDPDDSQRYSRSSSSSSSKTHFSNIDLGALINKEKNHDKTSQVISDFLADDDDDEDDDEFDEDEFEELDDDDDDDDDDDLDEEDDHNDDLRVDHHAKDEYLSTRSENGDPNNVSFFTVDTLKPPTASSKFDEDDDHDDDDYDVDDDDFDEMHEYRRNNNNHHHDKGKWNMSRFTMEIPKVLELEDALDPFDVIGHSEKLSAEPLNDLSFQLSNFDNSFISAEYEEAIFDDFSDKCFIGDSYMKSHILLEKQENLFQLQQQNTDSSNNERPSSSFSPSRSFLATNSKNSKETKTKKNAVKTPTTQTRKNKNTRKVPTTTASANLEESLTSAPVAPVASTSSSSEKSVEEKQKIPKKSN
jgi:hypothetical protein